MKRAPGLRERRARLRRGRHRPRTQRVERHAVEARAPAPSAWRAAISPRMPSAMARLDEASSTSRRAAGIERIAGHAAPVAQASAALPAVSSKAAVLRIDDVLLGAAAEPAEQGLQPRAHSPRRRRRSRPCSGARSSPASSGVISSSSIAPSDRRMRARRAVKRDFVESRAVDDQRLARRPCAASVCAIRRSILGSATPSSCTGGRAGLMHGPSRFIIVRTWSCRRTSAACFIPG